jgi:hypothetical protein
MSDKIDDGGPAFPVQVTVQSDGTIAGTQFGNRDYWHTGLSLRDYFAAAALNQRKALSYGGWYAADAAREAYEIADAMLKARNQ